MNKTNIFKKGLVFLLVLLSTLTLVACKKDELKVPYGNLGETVYLSSASHKITEKDLYTEMRLSATVELEKMFFEIIFQEELDQVDAFLNKYDKNFDNVDEDDETMRDDLIYYINESAFGYTDIERLKEIDQKQLDKMIYRYVDSMFFAGVSIDANDLDTVEFTNYTHALLKFYRLDVAKKIYAREQIKEDVEDKDSNVYIKQEDDIEDYFKNEVKKRYPLSAINIRFTNKFEADETLRHFNIKVYRSQWYLLPDPRTEVIKGDAFDFLVDAIGQERADSYNGSLSNSDHKLYYEKYNIETGRTPIEDEKVEKPLELDEIVSFYIKIYNTIYPYREKIDENLTLEQLLNNQKYVNDDEENLGIFTKLYKDFVGSQSSFRTYLYNTLSTDEDGTQYISSPRAYGEHYFLSFKLKDHNEDLLTQVDEDDEYILWADEGETELTDYSQEYYQELVDSKLTTSYISTKANERLKDAKITLYDEYIQLSLNQTANREYKLAKKFNNDLVAKIDDTEITVQNLYDRLEQLIGPSIALDLAVRHMLFNSEYMDKIDKDKLKEYRENVENVLMQFGQGAFESSGFSPEIGRKNFLLLAFRSETIEEAVNKIYVNEELENLFVEDIEANYSEDIYEFFADYANKYREQFFGLTSSHLLIYVDIDEDDQPDKPEDFFNYLIDNDKADQVDEYKQLITDLMRDIYDEAIRFSSFKNGLEHIVSEYNRATKIVPAGDEQDGQKEIGPDHYWAKYKQKGLVIKFEDLGSTHNGTNYPTSGGGFDDAFFDRLHHLYKQVARYDEETGEIPNVNDLGSNFPKQILDDKPTEFSEVLQTAFGWHLILVNSAEAAATAEFTEKDDKLVDGEEHKIYENIIIKDKDGNELPPLNIYNGDGEEKNKFKAGVITSNQVRVYLYEKDSEYGLENIPSKIKAALEQYLDPVVETFYNNYMKMYLFSNYFDTANYTYANAANYNKVLKIREINENQFYEYTNLIDQDNLYYDIYKTWFTDLENLK